MMRPLLFAAIAAAVVPAMAAAADMRPNILIILADDQGWGDLSLNGNTNLRTPRIDSLAKDGARFERFFVQPVCSPTRAELLTGRWHPCGGVQGVSTGAERLDRDERTIAEAFRAAGYASRIAQTRPAALPRGLRRVSAERVTCPPWRASCRREAESAGAELLVLYTVDQARRPYIAELPEERLR